MSEGVANSVWALIQELAGKKGITEIVINNPHSVFVERAGQFIQLKASLTKTHILEFINEVAKYNKKECNSNTPILDGNMPDGSRINVIMCPFVQDCPAITIRKYLKNIKSFDAVPSIFGLTPKWVTFLKALVHAKANVIVSGGTGVGKTTLLNLLLHELNLTERVITIEDTIELSVDIPNLVRLEARNGTNMTLRELVKNTLRMRPDRIIIGETRGGELFDLLQAMNTGHDGSMSSIHASSPAECLSRMETLFMMAGFDVPVKVIRKQISTAVNFLIQLERGRDGSRILSQISEITGMESENILLQTIATYEDGSLRETGITPKILNVLHQHGGLPLDFFNS